MTQTKREPFNAGDFSSRKLMELVSGERDGDRLTLDQEALDAVVSELASRRHYLRELRDRGLLAPARPRALSFQKILTAPLGRRRRVPETNPGHSGGHAAAGAPDLCPRRHRESRANVGPGEHCMANCLAPQRRALHWQCSSVTTAAWPDSTQASGSRTVHSLTR